MSARRPAARRPLCDVVWAKNRNPLRRDLPCHRSERHKSPHVHAVLDAKAASGLRIRAQWVSDAADRSLDTNPHGAANRLLSMVDLADILGQLRAAEAAAQRAA